MKYILVSALVALATVSLQAQGTLKFSNNSTTKISTNLVAGGAATGIISPSMRYRFALYASTTATSVNGGTTNISGAAGSYVFDDANWTLVAYGTNMFTAGQFVSASANVSGATTVSNVAGGDTAQFVVVGWSGNNGATITDIQSWFNGGDPASSGWIGQSAVSGPITLGTTNAATLFGTNAPAIRGFTLGLVVPAGSAEPVITSQPANQTVAPGATATFSVGATGTPSPSYQWFFNSNAIAGATSATLTINNVQATNAGWYSVLVTNAVGGTNSFAATLTVTNAITNSTSNGYVIFANNSASIDKIYTNSAVGGAATGLTAATNRLYFFALYVSTNATDVNGETSPITGSASSNYAFSDTNWTLVAYGTNSRSGMFKSSLTNGPTLVPGIAGGATAQFVVIGWSASIGTDITAVESWFNGGSPAADGWIGQSAVSGALALGNGGSIRVPLVLNTNAPSIQGFTLGLASPNQTEVYSVPVVPPAVLQTKLTGNIVQLSWLTASGSFGVQSAPSPFGPWTDTGWTAASDGVNSVVTVTNSVDSQFYRLVPQ